MSALRKSLDLQSVKTRHIVMQNEDGSFPPAYSLIATDAKGLGNTEWVQDISMNSVTLFGNTATGVLAYSDVSGLLLNSVPFAGGGSGSIGATGPAGSIGATGPAGLLTGLTSANAGSGIDITGTPLNPIISSTSSSTVSGGTVTLNYINNANTQTGENSFDPSKNCIVMNGYSTWIIYSTIDLDPNPTVQEIVTQIVIPYDSLPLAGGIGYVLNNWSPRSGLTLKLYYLNSSGIYYSGLYLGLLPKETFLIALVQRPGYTVPFYTIATKGTNTSAA